jgi:hypothetical protein
MMHQNVQLLIKTAAPTPIYLPHTPRYCYQPMPERHGHGQGPMLYWYLFQKPGRFDPVSGLLQTTGFFELILVVVVFFVMIINVIVPVVIVGIPVNIIYA